MFDQELLNEIMNNEALINAVENLTLNEFNTLPSIIKIKFLERSIENAMKVASDYLIAGNVLSAKVWIEKAERSSREINYINYFCKDEQLDQTNNQ